MTQAATATVWNESELLSPQLLDQLLDQLAEQKPLPSIVQIGAFDGQTGDPLVGFLHRHRARAVLLEPQPGPFASLQAMYSHNSAVVPVNAALAATCTRLPLYVVSGKHPQDPWWCGQVASFHREHLLRHSEWIPDLAQRIQVIKVPSITPNALMQRYSLTDVDALIVDAEGADWQLVRLFFDEGILPQIVFFEWRHLSASEWTEAQQSLTKIGYQFQVQQADCVAWWDTAVCTG